MNIDKILNEIADKNNVSVEEVLNDIQEALDYGWNSKDEKVQEYWRKIPTNYEKPTLEEVILYIINSINK